MQGWKCLVLGLFVISLTACSGKSMLQADCHSCTEEEQLWEDFAFAALAGTWQGSLEMVRSEGKEKKKEEKRAEFRFVDARTFFSAKKVSSCAGLPESALVLNGQLWDAGQGSQEFDAFAEAEDGRVAYGRITVDKDACRFQRLGRVMGRNRLALPAVQFSLREAAKGRAPASDKESDISVEFLRFDPAGKKASTFEQGGRKPASAEMRERPALLIRVYKTSSLRGGAATGALSGTEEYLYRLWKTN